MGSESYSDGEYGAKKVADIKPGEHTKEAAIQHEKDAIQAHYDDAQKRTAEAAKAQTSEAAKATKAQVSAPVSDKKVEEKAK